ncbi:MAG: phospholipid carrier-dependent glycosyltransferase [Nocardiaceae bacterium]|nr:phospholipid carrier-dependent glycosyltransferase [Nocardiaceae bacterium]
MISPAPTVPQELSMPNDRLEAWLITLVLTLLAAITRFTMVQSPTDAGTPVFDEKHYAPQAWQVLQNGGLEDNPGYGLVVHPPFGKQLMAIGEAIFGYSGLGWRFSAAACGTILVLLVIRIVRRLARSTMIGAFAGVLMICDGLMFVSSRIGMLDIFLTVLVVAALGCLVVDRDDVRARMAKVYAEGRIEDSPWGPRLGVRWWRFGAGVLLGLACATKWSGLYFVAFFGVMCLAMDYFARRAYRVQRPLIGTALRDAIPALYALVAVPIVAYLLTYAPWFASEFGVGRYVVGTKIGTTGPYAWIPDGLRSLWYYSGNVLNFHEELTNSAGNRHPWESKPWTWPMGLRPMLYYFSEGSKTCTESGCIRAVMAIGTPAIWWLALPAYFWGVWRWLVKRDWRYGIAVIGYSAALLPWFTVLDRQMYFFYAVAMAPFMCMLMAMALGEIVGRARNGEERRKTGLLAVSIYLGIVVANFIWLYPILTAMPISPATWNAELWLPSWR